MPDAVYECGFSLPSFNHKATLLIGSNCSPIICENTDANPVEVQLREGVVQKQTDCLASKSVAKQQRIINRDRHRSSAILSVYAVEFDFSD